MSQYFPIFNQKYPVKRWKPIDLSANNHQLEFERTAESDYLSGFIASCLSEDHPVAYGGYGEKRATYRNASHFSDMPEEEVRCIHLGVDLWVEQGTEIYAPLEGEVHSFNLNDLPYDYGPTIILKHKVTDSLATCGAIKGDTFYTLYGHLSLDSLEGLKVGQQIEQGEAFAKVGDANVNGGWFPHLHFQVMQDMFGWVGDFPGATSEKEKEKFLTNSPNPAFILNLAG